MNKTELKTIPGIGKKLAIVLQNLGIRSVEDLKNKDPEKLYEKMQRQLKKPVDRCVLYAFRCAVYYASHKKHETEKLKWWNWKDK
jgi:predicted RecB family nuclease